MTRETYTQSPLYTISGTGPYAIIHPYQVDTEIKVTIFDGTTVMELDPAEYTVAPISSETTGDVTIGSDTATTYAGASLLIRRETVSGQGWAGQTARERGLEAQLDALTQRIQEIDEAVARAVKIPEGTINELPLVYSSSYLAFDESQNLITSAGLAETPVSTFMATVLDDTSAAAARTTLGIDTAALTYAGNQTLSNSWPMYHFSNTEASTDLKTWRVSVSTAGKFSINWASDDLGTVNAGLQIERDATGPTEYNFYTGAAVLAATVEAAGTTVAADTTLITKEKGDARYARAGSYAETLSSGGTLDAPTAGLGIIDTYASAAADDLTGMSNYGVAAGTRVTLMLANSARIVTIKPNGFWVDDMADFKLAGDVDFVFTDTTDAISFIFDGTYWTETSRSIN